MHKFHWIEQAIDAVPVDPLATASQRQRSFLSVRANGPRRLWVCATFLAIVLMLSISIEETAHAQQRSTHRDRRPDRERRITYPRSTSRPAHNLTTLPISPNSSPNSQVGQTGSTLETAAERAISAPPPATIP